MNAGYYSWQDDTLRLRLYVQPRASRDEIVGPHGDSLKIRLTAPPLDGQANAQLIKFLAREFGVARSHITITAGHSGRHKQLHIKQPNRLPAIIPAAH